MLFGMPQGSVVGPLLCVLYNAKLSHTVMCHGLQLHQYADDCQVYISTSTEDVPHAVDKVNACLAEDVNVWLSASQLWLNASKPQLM